MATCSSCNAEEARMRCGGCKSAYYCNAQCQRDNWKKHKKECKRIRKKLKANTKRIEDEEKSNIASTNFNNDNNTFEINMTANNDSSFINGMKECEIKDIFDRICNISLSVHHRITALNTLFWPRIAAKYPLYEKCGLIQRFQQVMKQSDDNLRQGNHGNEAFQIQMLSMHFLSGIVMMKNYRNSGRDGVDELYSLKLLKYASIWDKFFEFIQLRHCHIEFIRFLFRILTLMMNSSVLAKYIIENIKIDPDLLYLISICNETVDKTQFNGCTDSAFDSMQGLAWFIFYQIQIHSQTMSIREDVQKLLKQNDQNMFKMVVFPMVEKQISEHRGISMEEAKECINEAYVKKFD